MASPRRVAVKWREKKQRWEVSFYWDGYRNAFRFYSWTLPNGQKVSFTKENRGFADQFANYVRGLMMPNPVTGICNFDPCKLSRQKKSKHALRRYSKLWIAEYRRRVQMGDCSKGYVDLLEGYLAKHVEPVFGDASIFDIDTISIKEFYYSLSKNDLSKKHIQNIMDCLRMLLKSASEDLQGLDMPKFPKYREKRKVKIHNFLLREDQDKVISFVAPHHKAAAMTYIYYGLRRQEVINLKRQDLVFLSDKEGNRHPALKVKTLKGGPDRFVEIDAGLYREIMKIPPATCGSLFHLNGKPYYFKTFSKIIRRALDRAGFPNVRPHDASRHSRASQMAMMGASAYDIKNQLGHADIRTSEFYVHVLSQGKWVMENNLVHKR